VLVGTHYLSLIGEAAALWAALSEHEEHEELGLGLGLGLGYRSWG
jgi:hypothetical protein